MKSQELPSVTSLKAESAVKPVAIEVLMRIRVEGPKRPICLDCGHSVVSHGERDAKLFCWACYLVGPEQCRDKRKEQ
jgi:tRNA(Ile2) C34 agmatinyltransferase TiaS